MATTSNKNLPQWRTLYVKQKPCKITQHGQFMFMRKHWLMLCISLETVLHLRNLFLGNLKIGSEYELIFDIILRPILGDIQELSTPCIRSIRFCRHRQRGTY